MSVQPANQPAVQLLELGAHFALAERAAKFGYWRHQVGEEEPHWSPGFFALLSLDPAQVRPSADYLLRHIHKDDRMAVASGVATGVNEGKPFYYRCRIDVGNGERVVDTYGDVERDASGNVAALLGVVRDVTAEVASERSIREREAAYRFVAEEATDMIIRHDKDGMPLFVSPAVTALLGCTPDVFLREPPYTRVHPEDLEMVQRVLLEARDNMKMATLTYRMRHSDGRYIWCETRVRFVFDAATGEHRGAISISRDITEHKDFEDALHAARERAELASHTKSRFLANMSHELRTPLNAIMGFSDIIAREMFGPLGSERYCEYARMINESGSLLLDLINDLLDMSKIEAGKFELHIEEFGVGEIVEATARLLSLRADNRRVTISTAVSPSDLQVAADPRAFKQILLNLISNAVKFTDPGGAVAVSATVEDGLLRLAVRDTGIGIPADILPRLARPFEQVTNDPARAHGGSGLGLALVKSLTQLHGGEFSIESQERRGTTVTVTLPLRPADAERAA
jgi:two-component system, cell cycle sensor histidine kinase PleC